MEKIIVKAMTGPDIIEKNNLENLEIPIYLLTILLFTTTLSEFGFIENDLRQKRSK
jgi:hypothetical protein